MRNTGAEETRRTKRWSHINDNSENIKIVRQEFTVIQKHSRVLFLNEYRDYNNSALKSALAGVFCRHRLIAHS